MVRKSGRDAMKRPNKSNRKPPEDNYLSWDEVKKGEEYEDKKLGPIQVLDKLTANGKNIVLLRLKGQSYEYPKFFSVMKLKRKEEKHA